MTASTPLLLITAAAAALVLATAGCDANHLDPADVVPTASANALAVPPLGQEVFNMFAAEKANAPITELPAQF